MTRPSPWDLVFAGEVERRFDAVQSEAAASAKDVKDFAEFISLQSVQQIIRDIESPELLSEAPGAAAEYHTLLYVAFRFWADGKRVVPVADGFLETAQSDGHKHPTTTPALGDACYLQLPKQRFWAQIDPNAPHEPIDGLFVASSREGRQFTTVAVLGLRQERGGFSQVSATVSLDQWSAVSRSLRSPPFEPTMDGGRDAGFKSVTSIAELLLLAHLALAQSTS